MADARKKVVVRSLEGEVNWCYLPQSGFVVDGRVDALDISGRAIAFELSRLKTIAYVKDFNVDDSLDPERLGRRSFLGRPRGDGIWLKVEFRDGETLEGLVHFDGSFLDGLMEDRGFRMAPPDARSNTQMIFVPRTALAGVEVLGYIAAPGKKKAKATSEAQRRLFVD